MNDKQMYILAIDQGTTSTRPTTSDRGGQVVATGQHAHEQILPRSGWVEHDPLEIWRNTRNVVGDALVEAEINRHQLAAVGITNQRETAVVWDKNTGEPVYNAIVWQDRSEEHTSELQSRGQLVCRLLLEKKMFYNHAPT